VAPRRDEVPARPGDATQAAFQREAPVRSTAARDSWAGWMRQLGFALAVVAMLLTAMAIFSRAASLF
jgi:hypothetical protein